MVRSGEQPLTPEARILRALKRRERRAPARHGGSPLKTSFEMTRPGLSVRVSSMKQIDGGKGRRIFRIEA